ncbi:class I SAM-dependent methyltransferase [Halomonas sp. M5N1S17]|uniref:class I SAM-dependent methyltransferase n=1 Tax=Halomonas alkalisoli TaxID=2907158 RepID=UPI001F423E9A|nr:class I SAM-dependent methyltransferase [Halomonas alkalisoli]MCE9663942.1 class I SAM-dependent methyltransferase [Halomonas alkalisoli]
MASEGWDQVASQVNFNLEIDRERFCGVVNLQAKVLDFGCGYGRIVKELTECGYTDVIGIDPSSVMVERGCRMFPGLSLLHSSKAVLPFDDRSFDAVVACAVFTCIPSLEERAEAVAEIARVLKPGGFLHISEFCSEEGTVFTSGLGISMRYSRPEELRELFGGFQYFHDEVVGASTMSGKNAQSYRAFVKKPLNKEMHVTSA